MHLHHSRPRINQKAIVIAFTVFAVLLAVGLAIVYTTGPKDGTKRQGSDERDIYNALTFGDTTTTTNFNPKVVNKEYKEAVAALASSTARADETISQVFTRVEDKLLTMRVPQEMLDDHLRAVLDLGALKGQFNQGTAVTKEQIIEIVTKLRATLESKKLPTT